MSENQAILMNLPPDIILDIFSRLPIRASVRCKCVCRQLLELITSAAFAELWADLHLPRSTPGVIIQHSSDFLCKMFEFQAEVEVQNHDLHHKQFMEFNPRAIITIPNARIRMRDGGSVNGLLCLVENDDLNNFYICNPITHEYIALPEPEEVLDRGMVAVCGFGVSSSSGEYKLVRISHGPPSDSASGSVPDLKCLIYTVGTRSWRSITVGITSKLKSFSPHVFLNGNLHWLVGDAVGSSFIACFNLETELFNSFPWIPVSIPFQEYGSMGVLGDCLCVCECTCEGIVVWVMKDYGVGESWTKEYVIDLEIMKFFWIVHEGIRPLKGFKDGDILFVCKESGLFYYSTKTETDLHFNFFDWTEDGRIVAMLHTPSLLSLKRFDKEIVASFEY